MVGDADPSRMKTGLSPWTDAFIYNLGLTSESAIIIMKYKQINGNDEIYCVNTFALVVGGHIVWQGMGRPGVAR